MVRYLTWVGLHITLVKEDLRRLIACRGGLQLGLVSICPLKCVCHVAAVMWQLSCGTMALSCHVLQWPSAATLTLGMFVCHGRTDGCMCVCVCVCVCGVCVVCVCFVCVHVFVCVCVVCVHVFVCVCMCACTNSTVTHSDSSFHNGSSTRNKSSKM